MFFKTPLALILSITAACICAYASWKISALSKKLVVGKGKKMAATLSIILIVPCVIIFIYILSQLSFLEAYFLADLLSELNQ